MVDGIYLDDAPEGYMNIRAVGDKQWQVTFDEMNEEGEVQRALSFRMGILPDTVKVGS